MKSYLYLFTTVLLLNASPVFSADGDMQDLMARAGSTFTLLKKAVLVDGDLGDSTLANIRTLSTLFYQTVAITPDLDHLTTDPVEKSRLTALFHQYLSETLGYTYEFEGALIKKDLATLKILIAKIADKRAEAHVIFKKVPGSRHGESQ